MGSYLIFKQYNYGNFQIDSQLICIGYQFELLEIHIIKCFGSFLSLDYYLLLSMCIAIFCLFETLLGVVGQLEKLILKKTKSTTLNWKLGFNSGFVKNHVI